MLHSRSIRWRIAIPYVAITLVAMTILAVYLTNLVRDHYLDDLRSDLLSKAQMMADALEPSLASGGLEEAIDPVVRRYSDLFSIRITILGEDGTVLADSHADSTQMDSRFYRAEVQEALSLGQGGSIRLSQASGQETMYMAVPIHADGQPKLIVRTAVPVERIEASIAPLRTALLLSTLLSGGLAFLLAVIIAERTARPVRQLTQVAERVAEGDLSARILPSTRDEIGLLTLAFNRMTEQLQEKIMALSDERSRLTAVMDHMADGMLITDGEGRVRLLNPAGARLLGTTEEEALGRSFAEVVRQHRLIDLWRQCRTQDEEQIEAVEMGRQDLFLQATMTPLQGTEPQACLVILHDLTRIRQLESVRQDFISNISHELRTPLASLKALLDTLRDGALDDPPAAQRFLDSAEREVDALTHMVQELLELSRVEGGQAPLDLVPTQVPDLILRPVELLRPQTERAGLQLAVDLPPDIPKVLADAERIQQTVLNLVHNAIKFTPPGGSVRISAEPGEDEVIVSVRDTGVGISPDALPRIFERFYKADRARAGGGTGLGLAIAKHTVQSHGGRIWAESSVGEGSVFHFSLPIAPVDEDVGPTTSSPSH